MIRLEQVRKAFNEGKANEFWAIRGVDLELDLGGVTVVRGPSGSGKTTLLTLIGAMVRPTSGRITLHGKPLSGLPERFLTQVRRRTFGFVFQRFHLLRGLTALENVMLPGYPLGPPPAQLRERAVELLGRLGLGSKQQARAEELSGGEAQRTAIARALLNDPAVLIADEPTAHLDTSQSGDLLHIVGTLAGEGKTVLIASHDPLVYEAPCVDRVVRLRDGLLEGPD